MAYPPQNPGQGRNTGPDPILSFKKKAKFLIILGTVAIFCLSSIKSLYTAYLETESQFYKIVVLIFASVLIYGVYNYKTVIRVFKGLNITLKYLSVIATLCLFIFLLIVILSPAKSIPRADIVIANFDETVEAPYSITIEGYSMPVPTLKTSEYIEWQTKRWIIQYGLSRGNMNMGLTAIDESTIPKDGLSDYERTVRLRNARNEGLIVARSNKTVREYKHAKSILTNARASSIVWGFDYMHLDNENGVNSIYPIITYKESTYPSIKGESRSQVIDVVPMIAIENGIKELDMWIFLAVLNSYFARTFEHLEHTLPVEQQLGEYIGMDVHIPQEYLYFRKVAEDLSQDMAARILTYILEVKDMITYYDSQINHPPKVTADDTPEEGVSTSPNDAASTKPKVIHPGNDYRLKVLRLRCIFRRLLVAYNLFTILHNMPQDEAGTLSSNAEFMDLGNAPYRDVISALRLKTNIERSRDKPDPPTLRGIVTELETLTERNNNALEAEYLINLIKLEIPDSVNSGLLDATLKSLQKTVRHTVNDSVPVDNELLQNVDDLVIDVLLDLNGQQETELYKEGCLKYREISEPLEEKYDTYSSMRTQLHDLVSDYISSGDTFVNQRQYEEALKCYFAAMKMSFQTNSPIVNFHKTLPRIRLCQSKIKAMEASGKYSEWSAKQWEVLCSGLIAFHSRNQGRS